MSEQAKILIVEDDVDLVEAMKITLLSKNYQVDYAYNTDEGLQKAKERNPDLILLDVMFGSKQQTKGFEFAVNIKQDKALSHIPILMITALTIHQPGFSFDLDIYGEYLPVDDFLYKPVEPESLLSKVEKLLKVKTSIWVNWPKKM